MKEAVRQRARELGFDDCRFTTAHPPDLAEKFTRWLEQGYHGEMAYLQRSAHKRVDPQLVLPGAKSILTLSASYAAAGSGDLNGQRNKRSEMASAPRHGIVARYARYSDYHEVLATRLKSLTDFISQLAGADARSLWYVDTGPLLERELAQRAGLGFVGKHTNLISRQLGNWLFLSEVITTLDLAPDASERNRCGSCTRCLAACPTQAIRAPFQLDAKLCISYLTIELKGSIPVDLRPALGARIYGCDDCLEACPWNRFAREGQLMKAHSRPDLSTPDLLELLSLDELEFKRRFAQTPIFRVKRRGLLRNVCVALGNVGNRDSLPALERAMHDPEPLISEHARWAVQQILRRAG